MFPLVLDQIIAQMWSNAVQGVSTVTHSLHSETLSKWSMNRVSHWDTHVTQLQIPDY